MQETIGIFVEKKSKSCARYFRFLFRIVGVGEYQIIFTILLVMNKDEVNEDIHIHDFSRDNAILLLCEIGRSFIVRVCTKALARGNLL